MFYPVNPEVIHGLDSFQFRISDSTATDVPETVGPPESLSGHMGEQMAFASSCLATMTRWVFRGVSLMCSNPTTLNLLMGKLVMPSDSGDGLLPAELIPLHKTHPTN